MYDIMKRTHPLDTGTWRLGFLGWVGAETEGGGDGVTTMGSITLVNTKTLVSGAL